MPATLALSLGAAPTFGAFQPGVSREYTASTTANVISTAGDAALTVERSRATWPTARSRCRSRCGWRSPRRRGREPTSNEAVAITFKQAIGANDKLRTGSYTKTLTFTLSTTNPLGRGGRGEARYPGQLVGPRFAERRVRFASLGG